VEQKFVPFVPRESVIEGPPGTIPSEGVDSWHDPGGTYSPPEAEAGTVLKDSWSDPDFSEATKWLDKTLAADFPRYIEKWEQHGTEFTPAYSDPDTYKQDAADRRRSGYRAL
jgi:hypothetical protein